MRSRYFDTHVPLTSEESNLRSREARPYVSLLDDGVRLVTDLPLHCDGRFVSFFKRQATR